MRASPAFLFSSSFFFFATQSHPKAFTSIASEVLQATGVTPPMLHSVAFYLTVSLGSTVMLRREISGNEEMGMSACSAGFGSHGVWRLLKNVFFGFWFCWFLKVFGWFLVCGFIYLRVLLFGVLKTWPCYLMGQSGDMFLGFLSKSKFSFYNLQARLAKTTSPLPKIFPLWFRLFP